MTVLIGEILEAVNYVFPLVLDELPQKERWRKGGFLCCKHGSADNEPPILLCKVGSIYHPGKAQEYFRFAQEKVNRLCSNFERGHVSSWQSRDETRLRYGGAIRAAGLYLSFSGLPEKADEAFCLLIAMWLEWLDEAGARDIARISRNRFFLRLPEEAVSLIA
ncbi:MAG: hypothetical protein Q7N87_02910 [Candidatus Uhrbacteria bacterium]|nr:hypothetical protein [Candidatus Uhrbacteria bacterium]